MAISLNTSSNITPGQNKCLLNHWAALMMESEWNFNQCAGKGAPLQTGNDQAGSVYLQKEREYIARSLESAADRMADSLNYAIRPMYFTETIPLGTGYPLGNQIHQARWLKMIALGTRATTLIQAGVAVVYSDPNSIGVNDTATVTVVTGIANAEIKLYFQVADGAPTAGDYRYEIEPTIVTDALGTVTIKAHRSLFVKPAEWAREYVANDPNFNSPNIVDTATAAGFVTAVDVYRVWTNSATPISLLSANGVTLQTYTGYIVDAELSAFRLGGLCSDFCLGCGDYPISIQVNYYAGSPLVNSNVDGELYQSCVAYAAGSMMSKMSGMSYWSLDLWNKYHAPMVETINGSLVPIATKLQSSSGFGARYGQAMAWETVMDRRIERGRKFF